MARTADSSKWYLPLVAGLESVSRSTPQGQYPAEGLIDGLPGPCTKPWPGMVLWLDSASSVSTEKAGSSIYRVRDRSGNENNAVQGTPSLQPQDNLPGYNFKD